ncbi:MAG: MFS transporter [Mycobacteriales bacterium]
MTTTLDATGSEQAIATGTGTGTAAGQPPDPGAPYRWRWLAYTAVLAASVMDLLDATISSVAAPSIRHSLGGSYADLQWIAAGYTLAMAVTLLTGGRLGDMFGRRRMLLVGMAGFTLASLACAAAVSPETLTLARVLQGGFGAVMLPQGFGLIRELFPPYEMGKVWGVFGPVMGLSAILGPIVAGGLIGADLFGTGWRMIFLINVPVGVAALAVAVRFLPASAPELRSTRLDLPGVGLAATGTFLLVFPLVQGRELGWPGWVKAMLVASAPVLVAFGWYQVRRKRSGRTPLIEPSVFARRSYVSGVLFALAFLGGLGGMMLTVGVLLQVGLGYTPMHASLTMSPWGVGALVGSGFGGAMMHRLGRRILHLGLAVMAAGILGLYAVLGHDGVHLSAWHLVVPNLAGGIGMGMIFVPLFDIVMGGLAPRELGSGSGILQAVNQLGTALGVAVLGTLFFSVAGGQAHHQFNTAAAPGLHATLAAHGVTGHERDALVARVRACVAERENETDPDVVPASCRTTAGQPTDPAVTRAIATAATITHRRDAVTAAERTLLATTGLVGLAFLLGFLLPRKARQQGW